MKPCYTVKCLGKSVIGLKNQKGKIVEEMAFSGLAYPNKLWQANFGNDIGIHSVPQDDLEIVSCQFQLKFSFMEESA
jgi:hypothetical protein